MDLQGTKNADTLTGGADSDTIYGFAGNDTLKGLGGDDVLAGHDGNDTLLGGAGDDYLLGGAGNDTLDGGDGNDWAAYEDATAGVKVDLTITGSQNTGGGGIDKLISIENVYGSAFNDTLIGDAKDNMLVGDAGNDTISGGKGNDTLWGDAGDDVLDGGDGDDYIVGGAGNDIIKGGAGVDWASYENATAGVTVDLNKTTAQNTGGAGVDTITGVELLYGSKFDDVLTGDAKDNYLWGSDGDDKLYGGAGDDHLSGGNGADLIDGGDGFDTVDYSFSTKGVYVDLQQRSSPYGGDYGELGDRLISIEAVMGSSFNDVIYGNAAENYLYGDAGNDLIQGFGGNDTIDGGDGDDSLFSSYLQTHGEILLGGAGSDYLVATYTEGMAIMDGGEGIDTLAVYSDAGVTVDLRISGEQQVTAGLRLDIRNIENLDGNRGNDHLIGNAGDNVLNGGAGDDILDGGDGFDIASYETSTAVRVDLSKAGVAQDTRGGGTDTLINIEGLKGSAYADVLIGDAKDNTLQGGYGDDILDGGAGVDTAIFVGKASQYTWSLNANGTWTVKGSEGVDTLLNIETLKFADKTVTLTPSTTTVTVDDLIGGTKLLVTSGVKDAIFSADGQTIYVATADGHVKAIGAATGELRADFKVGTQLGGMDVSVDGRYLVVTEGQLVDRHSPGGSPAPMAAVHVVDLQTGLVKDYMTFVNGEDRGFVDAAFLSDGKIMLTQASAGTGSTPITTLDLASQTFTRGATGYGQSGYLSVSNDHKTVLLAPTGASPSSLFVFTAAQGEVAHLVSGGNVGQEVISGDGSLIAQGGALYDKALNFLFGVSSPYLWQIHGFEFSADGKHFYMVDAVEDRIYDFSTATGDLLEAYDIGVDINPVTLPDGVPVWGYGDRVSMSADGQHMLIMDGDKVVSVNMMGPKLAGGTQGADVIVGQNTGAALLLRGFGGDDRISGAAYNDTIIGGKGADTLKGGLGDDTFVFAAGDTTWSSASDAGVDVILDWEAGDRLSFGPHSEYVHYAEQTSGSWLAAATTAPQIMASQHLSYLAVQVGADVYVFAAPSGAANGAIENVVKLANTTLDKISIDNFLPVGDDNANTLIGGALNDRIYAYGGDDTIKGGQGADILFGGKGIDTFVFEAGDTTWSSASDAGVDTIMDWEAGDKLSFGPLGSSFSLSKLTANSWSEALADASQPGGSPSKAYMAYQVGGDVYVFYAPDSATGVVENVVKLANTTLAKIDLTTFIPGVGLPIDGDDNANVLTGGVLQDYIDGKGGDDVINGGKGDDVLTGGAGADVFKFLAGDGSFSLQAGSPLFAKPDVITDFGAGDKLAFSGAAATVTAADILNLGHWDVIPGTNPISAAMELYFYAQAQQHEYGAISQKYMVFGVGADTYVLADNDAAHAGYDQVVLLKNFSSSLVTADLFMAA